MLTLFHIRELIRAVKRGVAMPEGAPAMACRALRDGVTALPRIELLLLLTLLVAARL